MNLTEENFGESPFMLNFNNSSSINSNETDTDSVKSEDNNDMSVTQDSPSNKDVLTRLDSLLSGNDVTSDESDATQSVSDIFAKITRDKRKPEKPGTLNNFCFILFFFLIDLFPPFISSFTLFLG